jgi:integrase
VETALDDCQLPEHLALRICGFDLGGGRTLGTVRVRDLRREHAEALVIGMKRAGYAPATTALSYGLFSQLCDRGVSRRLLAAHPVDREFYKKVLKPHLKTSDEDADPKALTEAETTHFLTIARQHSRLYPLYATGFTTGCRSVELLALQLTDDQVNLVAGERIRQLQVARTLTKGRTKHPTTGPTKSGKTRYVDIGTDLGHLLDRLKAQRPAEALRHGWRPIPPWVFTTSKGTPFGQTTPREEFVRLLHLAGLDGRGFTLHSMRHTFASLHILRGCDPKWLQQQMGHATIGITYDIYGNWFRRTDQAAASALGAALLGNHLATRAPAE